MNDAKLQKINLPSDFIDLSFGEPFIVANACRNNLTLGNGFKDPLYSGLHNCQYQLAQGAPKLTSLLQEKYGAKVVVTNGAKHGLAAILYALKKNGHDSIHYESPYYPANPSLLSFANLSKDQYFTNSRAMLITSPNNPDGNNHTNMFMKVMTNEHYVIHDAAYYTPIYLPEHQTPEALGHIQLYSMSKMYGFSGLRVGYVVCHDEVLFQDIVDYVELTTAGVSIASQDIAYNLETFFAKNPNNLNEFEQEAREAIKVNRSLLSQLDPEVISFQECMSNSMFGWGRKGPKLDYMNKKVYILDGSLFGDDAMVRMNLAVPYDALKEAIDRLNK
jgi:aspartate/methionine/tyrosine aminotransferase